jgi:hypothetical protein
MQRRVQVKKCHLRSSKMSYNGRFFPYVSSIRMKRCLSDSKSDCLFAQCHNKFDSNGAKKKSDLPGVTVGFWIYYYHDSHSEPQTAGILYMIVIPSLNLTLISIFHYITLGTPGSSKARSYADVHTVWTENCVPYIMVLTRNAKISGQEIGAAAFTNNINHFKATVVVVVWITYDMIWCDTIYLFTAIGFPPGGSDR